MHGRFMTIFRLNWSRPLKIQLDLVQNVSSIGGTDGNTNSDLQMN